MTLREARKALGWTQQKLSAESKVPQQQISELELDQVDRVAYRSVMLILKAFHRAGLKGLSAEELFPVDAAGEPAESTARGSEAR